MIGKAPRSAAPSIMFCCEILDDRRYVRNMIKESGILDCYLGIKTGHMPRPPGFCQLVPLADGDEVKRGWDNMFMLGSKFGGVGGSQLILAKDGEDPRTCSARATIGGVIAIKDDYYYTTAAHALQPDSGFLTGHETSYPEDYAADDDAFSLDGSDTSTDSAMTYSHEEAQAPLAAITPDSYQNEIVRKLGLEHETSGESSSIVTRIPEPELLIQPIGKASVKSSMDSVKQAAGLDYALIQVTSHSQSLFNWIEYQFNIASISGPRCVAKVASHDVSILAATSRGVITSYISGTPSYSSKPGNRFFNKLFIVNLDQPLQRGDCGAWIVDALRGDLYGHIIAGSPDDGLALVAPFEDIFEDIHSRWGRPPSLPTVLDEMAGKEANNSGMEMEVGALFRSMQREVSQNEALNPMELAKEPFPDTMDSKGKDAPTDPSSVSIPSKYDLLRLSRPNTLAATSLGGTIAPNFRDMLFTLSQAPLDWEIPEIQSTLLRIVEIDKIQDKARQLHSQHVAKTRSLENGRQPEWDYQFFLILALSNHLRYRTFNWITIPPCEACGAPRLTTRAAMWLPRLKGLNREESYPCANATCSGQIRLLRHFDHETANGLQSKTYCLGILCRAVGSRVRWVWNAEGLEWVEFYSEHQKHCVHVSASGKYWDMSTVYTEEKGKRISYCIAFSVDGATDVTNRYVQRPGFALPRTRCSEEDLRDIIQEIRIKMRKSKSEEERLQLESEDAAEARELQSYVDGSITSEPSGPLSGSFPRVRTLQEIAAMAAKSSGLSKADSIKRAIAEAQSSKCFYHDLRLTKQY